MLTRSEKRWLKKRNEWSVLKINVFREEGVYLKPRYLCERCGEIYLNLTAAGQCVIIDRNLKLDLQEYWEMSGFKKEEMDGKTSI